jgi:mannose-6-phosphate isomerase-like protein (cupin superfamily)
MQSGKYGKYFTKEPFVRGPFGHPKLQYYSGDRGGDINFGVLWNYITGPYRVPYGPHTHPFDEVWLFLGGDQSNAKDFDAEVEVYIGEEGEKHTITSATILEIPRGLVHCPLIFKRVDKPILFVNLPLTPKYFQAGMEPGKYGKYFTKEPFNKGPFGHPRLNYHTGDRSGDINFGVSLNYLTGPDRVPDGPHTHPFDEVWLFLGGDQSNAKDFDAEAEVYLGEEGEKYTITSATVLEIPRGLVHAPLIFKRVDKPILFVNLPLTPKYVQTETKKKA